MLTERDRPRFKDVVLPFIKMEGGGVRVMDGL